MKKRKKILRVIPKSMYFKLRRMSKSKFNQATAKSSHLQKVIKIMTNLLNKRIVIRQIILTVRNQKLLEELIDIRFKTFPLNLR